MQIVQITIMLLCSRWKAHILVAMVILVMQALHIAQCQNETYIINYTTFLFTAK